MWDGNNNLFQPVGSPARAGYFFHRINRGRCIATFVWNRRFISIDGMPVDCSATLTSKQLIRLLF